MADPEFGAFQAKECQNHLENAVLSKLPVEILVGKKNLEVRPTMVNKGEIVKRLLAQHPDVEFVACAGDDKTDEDMFRALAGQSNSHANNNRREQGNTVVEPYNDDLVAETAAKIAQATLEYSHSREQSPAVPHAHMNGHANGLINGSVAHNDGTHLLPSAPATPTPHTPSSSSTSSSTRGAAGEHFSITIGHALKRTLANWHVTSPEELIRVLGILSGVIDN